MCPVQDSGVSRRELLAAGGSLALLALAAPARVEALLAETARRAGAGRFLRAHELDALRACPRPPRARPARATPGPARSRRALPRRSTCFLGAFGVDPPLIHAGGPFSDRAGARRDDFARLRPLDRQAELGWRIRIEGSRGEREREFAGPVVGLQEIYRDGLARLDDLARARGAGSFAAARGRGAGRAAGRRKREPLVARFVDAALVHALEATLGPPEYGGNRALVGLAAPGLAGRHPAAGLLARAGDQPRSARAPARRDAPRAAQGARTPTPPRAPRWFARSRPTSAGGGRAVERWWSRAPGARAMSKPSGRSSSSARARAAGRRLGAGPRRPPRAVLEKGRNLLPGLGRPGRGRGTRFSNDEVKAARLFENPDPLLEPRTQRTQRRGAARRRALLRGRRQRPAHDRRRRHRALGREGAALLAPGLQGPLAPRAGRRARTSPTGR